jgi:hypothetical protein
MIRKLLHGLLAATILWLWFAMMFGPPVRSGPNDYIPPFGAKRTFQGDSINIDITGCGGGTESFSYRTINLSGQRTDQIVTVAGPGAACPAGNFVNAQIPLSDGYLTAVQINEGSVSADEGNLWIQTWIGRMAAQGAAANNYTASGVNGGPDYLFTCSPAQFQVCGWSAGNVINTQDDTILGFNLGGNFNWTIGNPAAGSQIAATQFPGGGTNAFRINIQSITFTLQTSAVVNNRMINIKIQAPSGGAVWGNYGCAITQPASTTATYTFGIATGPTTNYTITGATNPVIMCPLPSLVQWTDASVLSTNIGNFDPTVSTGDRITNFVVRTQWVNYRD